MDNYFTLDLQKFYFFGFTKVVKLELQNGFDKNTKNFERSDKEKKKGDVRTFYEESHRDSLQKGERRSKDVQYNQCI